MRTDCSRVNIRSIVWSSCLNHPIVGMLAHRDANPIFLERALDHSVPQYIIWSCRLLNKPIINDVLNHEEVDICTHQCDLLQRRHILDCLLHLPHLIRVNHRHGIRRPWSLTVKRWTVWVVWRVAVWEVLWVVDDGADFSSTVLEHVDKVQQSSLHRVPPQIKCRTRKFPCPRRDRRDETALARGPSKLQGTPRLFDLVLKELRFTHAFYRVLCDMLFVQDLA